MNTESEDLLRILDEYERDSKALKEETLRICWYMRGGLQYEDAMMLSQQEKKLIDKIIKDNMETTKKSGMPFF